MGVSVKFLTQDKYTCLDLDKMGRQIHTIVLKRERQGQKWGFGLTGGKDVSLTFRVEKVALASPAGASGLKNLDYLIKVNGTEVFEMKHSDVVQLIKNSPNDQLELEVERGDGNDVVPNFDWILAKEKGPETPSEDYYAVAMKQGLGPDSEIPCIFTACGPPRLKTGKYNVPTGLYSEDTIMELGSGGNFGFVEPENWLQMLVHVPKTGNVSTLPSQVHFLCSWIKNKVTFTLQLPKVQVHNNVYT